MYTHTPFRMPVHPPRLTHRSVLRTILSTLLFAADAVCAQDAPSEPSGLPLWEAGVFAGGLSTPAYPASSERNQRAIVLPFFIYRGEVLRADRNGLGARVVHTDKVEFDIGFSGSLPASSDDIALRRGMPDLGTLLEFGPRLKVKLAETAPGERMTLEVPLRAVLEFGGGVRQVGYALEPKLGYEWRAQGDWRLKGALGVVLGDQQLNQYFYSVPDAYATVNRTAFAAQGGLISTRLSLEGSKHLGPDLTLGAFVRYDLYDGAANRNSPLFAQNQGTSVGLGLAWTLGRSQQRSVGNGAP
jgi:MipA family protein